MSKAENESRHAVLPADAFDDADLTLSDLRVLGVIGYHSSRKRPAWPRQKTIAQKLGLARETVNRSVRRLWRKGYIDIAHQWKDSGGQRESYYFVRLDPDPEIQPVEVMVAGRTLKLEQRVTGKSHGQEVTPPDVTSKVTEPGHTPSAHKTSHLEEHTHRTSKKENPLPPEGGGEHRDDPKRRNIPAPVKAEFDNLWKIWPAKGRERSKAREFCLQAFAKACDFAPPPHVVEAAAAFVRKTEEKFVPALERWLRDRKFEHFLPAAQIAAPPVEGDLFAAPDPKIDWHGAVARWWDDGIWNRKRLGEQPDEWGYAGPLQPIEAILANGKIGDPRIVGLKQNFDALKAKIRTP